MKTEVHSNRRKRRAKPQEERRNDLMNACATVFAKVGVANAKIEDITLLAEVSKGTFYLYFTSKDQAAAAVWSRFVDEFIRSGELILKDTSVPTVTRLSISIAELIRSSVKNGPLQLAMYDSTGAAALKAAANTRLIGLFAKAIREGVKNGEIECAEPALVASSLFHGFSGSVADAIRNKKRQKVENLVKTVFWLVPRVFTPSERKSLA